MALYEAIIKRLEELAIPTEETDIFLCGNAMEQVEAPMQVLYFSDKGIGIFELNNDLSLVDSCPQIYPNERIQERIYEKKFWGDDQLRLVINEQVYYYQIPHTLANVPEQKINRRKMKQLSEQW